MRSDHALTGFGVLALVVSGDIVAGDCPCKSGAIRGGRRNNARHAFESTEQERALREVGHRGMVSCSVRDKNVVPRHLPSISDVARRFVTMV